MSDAKTLESFGAEESYVKLGHGETILLDSFTTFHPESLPINLLMQFFYNNAKEGDLMIHVRKDYVEGYRVVLTQKLQGINHSSKTYFLKTQSQLADHCSMDTDKTGQLNTDSNILLEISNHFAVRLHTENVDGIIGGLAGFQSLPEITILHFDKP